MVRDVSRLDDVQVTGDDDRTIKPGQGGRNGCRPEFIRRDFRDAVGLYFVLLPTQTARCCE